MATSWFAYDDAGSVNNPTSYTIVGMTSCPFPKKRLCAIFAEIQILSGQQRPIITSALSTEISNALNTLQESANVLLKPLT